MALPDVARLHSTAQWRQMRTGRGCCAHDNALLLGFRALTDSIRRCAQGGRRYGADIHRLSSWEVKLALFQQLAMPPAAARQPRTAQQQVGPPNLLHFPR